MSTKISYNLPGHGFSNCIVFDNASKLCELLDNHGIIEKSKNINQLGTMKYVYPGAHHTRYEYMFTQLMLISSVVTNKNTDEQRNTELSLGSYLKEFEANIRITGGDTMQCLAILSNSGFMFDTFTSDRILMRLLQESLAGDKSFYQMYRRNLPSEIHSSFDRYVQESNHYKLHLLHMIHLLEGMAAKQSDAPLCKFCISLLSKYVNPDLITHEATKRIIALYKKIRKIAYLSIDMIYTPAAVGVNLSRMIYTLPSYIDDLFEPDSPLNQTLSELEEIIHRQIYDSAKCILNSTRIEQQSWSSYEEAVSQCKKIYDFRHLLREQSEPFSLLHSRSTPDITKKLVPHSEILFEIPNDTVYHTIGELEDKVLRMLPNSRIAFGTQMSQNLKRTYAAFGLLSDKSIQRDTQTIISFAISHGLYSESNKKTMIKYAIQSLYEYGSYYYTLSSPSECSVADCVFIGRGCKKVAADIQAYLSRTTIANHDTLHEIKSVAHVLEELKYQGIVMCFVGGIKANGIKQTSNVDELDGFIYFPCRNDGVIAVIVEAKHYAGAGGGTIAKKQLDASIKHLASGLKTTITQLPKCAYMQVEMDD